MIKKLMKYDLKKMTNLLIYLYPITLLVAILTRIIAIGEDIQLIFIISKIFGSITYSLIGSIIVNTFVQILITFNQTFYKDQSYLTHTLPVEKSKLLISKYLSALIVILTTMVVSVASLFIVLYSRELMEILKVSIASVVQGFNVSGTVFILLIAGVLFSQICFLISLGFFGIIKANTYNEKRVLKGLAWFAVCYMVSMVVSLITIVLVFLITGNVNLVFEEVLPAKAFLTVIILGFVLYAIYAVAFYFIGKRLFNKGVNVD